MIALLHGRRLPCVECSATDETFAGLLALARGGSSDALGLLFAAQWRSLLIISRRGLDHRLAPKLSAEDLIQETFLDAQLGLQQFRGRRPEEFAAWLRAILANRLANSVRRYRLTKSRCIDRELPQAVVESVIAAACDSRSTPSIDLENRETRAQLAAGLRRMPPLVRQVLIERTCRGDSFREIAVRHACSQKVARRHWIRGLQELQWYLNAPPQRLGDADS